MWGAVFAVLALAAPSQAEVILSGRVVRIIGRDTIAVAGARVVLHRVTTARQGPIDSLLSRTDGSFSFRFQSDSGAIYLTSARWSGIEYFAPPATVAEAPAASDAILIAVADTSSTAPVALAARHVVVSAPATDGTRAVLELLVLENRGPLTRVARDATAPSWRMALPAGGLRYEVSNSDFATDAVEIRDGELRVHAALPPGQRELTVGYQLPAGVRRWAIPVADSVAALNVLAEEPTARLNGPLAAVDSQVVAGKRFSRWKGAVSPGAQLELEFDFTGTPGWILPGLVTALGATLLGTLIIARRRSRAPVGAAARATRAPPLSSAAARLLDEIAALDARFAGGVLAHDTAEWERYLAERNQLKQELEQHLPH